MSAAADDQRTLLQTLIDERTTLRDQNKHLWTLIDQQRQEITRAHSELDLLRQKPTVTDMGTQYEETSEPIPQPKGVESIRAPVDLMTPPTARAAISATNDVEALREQLARRLAAYRSMPLTTARPKEDGLKSALIQSQSDPLDSMERRKSKSKRVTFIELHSEEEEVEIEEQEEPQEEQESSTEEDLEDVLEEEELSEEDQEQEIEGSSPLEEESSPIDDEGPLVEEESSQIEPSPEPSPVEEEEEIIQKNPEPLPLLSVSKRSSLNGPSAPFRTTSLPRSKEPVVTVSKVVESKGVVESKAPEAESVTLAKTTKATEPKDSRVASPKTTDEKTQTKASSLEETKATTESSVKAAIVPQTEPEASTVSSLPTSVHDRISLLSKLPGLTILTLRTVPALTPLNKELTCFEISVLDGTLECWRIHKRYSDFLELHDHLHLHQTPEVMATIGAQPLDRSLFVNQSVSPSKSDQRLQTLQSYLQIVLQATLDDCEDILWFLSTDVVELMVERADRIFKEPQHQALKEGYLTKKGRTMGAWKRRYFVLLPDRILYFDSQEHAAFALASGSVSSWLSLRPSDLKRRSSFVSKSAQPLGSIQLKNARLAKQNAKEGEETSSPYRHALMISEPAEGGEMKRSILCAETDEDRDEWVLFVMYLIELGKNDAELPKVLEVPEVRPKRKFLPSELQPTDDVVETEKTDNYVNEDPTKKEQSLNSSAAATPSKNESPVISIIAPTPSNRSSLASTGGRQRRTMDWSQKLNRNLESVASTIETSSTTKNQDSSNIFGVPLTQAIQFSTIAEGYELPAIVYRCVEYLELKGAHLEEGIYRVSGSSTEIQELRQLFEDKGDVKLCEERKKRYDVHAVAGLLKSYLRELPTSILTNELHREFLNVTDLSQRSDRVIELARLVSYLPVPNYTLLRVLVAHLIKIVQHAEKNKMSAHNVGIVFSPTLGIPAGVLSLMMAEFEFVFWVEDASKDDTKEENQTENTSKKPEESKTSQKAKRTSMRKSWRPDQVEEETRSNRNSQIYVEKAPESVKIFEQLVLSVKGEEGQEQIDETESSTAIDLYAHTSDSYAKIQSPISLKENQQAPVVETQEQVISGLARSKLAKDRRRSKRHSTIHQSNLKSGSATSTTTKPPTLAFDVPAGFSSTVSEKPALTFQVPKTSTAPQAKAIGVPTERKLSFTETLALTPTSFPVKTTEKTFDLTNTAPDKVTEKTFEFGKASALKSAVSGSVTTTENTFDFKAGSAPFSKTESRTPSSKSTSSSFSFVANYAIQQDDQLSAFKFNQSQSAFGARRASSTSDFEFTAYEETASTEEIEFEYDD